MSDAILDREGGYRTPQYRYDQLVGVPMNDGTVTAGRVEGLLAYDGVEWHPLASEVVEEAACAWGYLVRYRFDGWLPEEAQGGLLAVRTADNLCPLAEAGGEGGR